MPAHTSVYLCRCVLGPITVAQDEPSAAMPAATGFDMCRQRALQGRGLGRLVNVLIRSAKDPFVGLRITGVGNRIKIKVALKQQDIGRLRKIPVKLIVHEPGDTGERAKGNFRVMNGEKGLRLPQRICASFMR